MLLKGLLAAATLVLCTTQTLASQEFLSADEREGMLACPQGTVATGLDVSKNLLLCFQGIVLGDESTDTDTRRLEMHACPEGSALTGIHVDDNKFLCAKVVGVKLTTVTKDDKTHRDTSRGRMHACIENQQLVVGVQVDRNQLLCSSFAVLPGPAPPRPAPTVNVCGNPVVLPCVCDQERPVSEQKGCIPVFSPPPP